MHSNKCRTRKENLVRAIEHESNGNSAAAYECYQKAVDISPSIAHELIQVETVYHGRLVLKSICNQIFSIQGSKVLHLICNFIHGYS